MGRSISVFVILLLNSVSLWAQWLKYPTRGIPRTRDGKPNLSARAPRTLDGKPDLSGIWNIQDAPGQTQFLDLAPSVPGGLPYRSGMADLAKARRAPPKTSEPITRCLPIGVVERHTWIGGLKKIVQTPGLLLILNEYNSSFRQIFTDGRPMPTIDQTAWDGYSTGKWEGDTLIVQRWLLHPRILHPNDLPTPKGPIDFGVTGAEFLEWAYMETNDFAKDPGTPQKQLRMIANIGKATFLVVAVKADSGITNLRQIVERRIPVKLVASTYTGGSIVPSVLDSYLLTEDRLKSFGGTFATRLAPGI